MARYVQFQVGDGTVNGKRLLSSDLLAEMHRPQVPAPSVDQGRNAALAAHAQGLPRPPSLITNTGYGLYWNTEDFEGHRLAWHDGASPGFTPLTVLVPETRSGAVILTNAHWAGQFNQVLRQHIAELLLNISPLHDTQQIVESQAKVLGTDNATRRARMAPARTYKADPAALRALVGKYTSVIGEAPSRVSVVDDTRLRLALSMQGATMDVELVPYSRRGFIANSGMVKGWAISFEPAEGGRTTLTAQGMPVAQK
jgi:hypothetical protein